MSLMWRRVDGSPYAKFGAFDPRIFATREQAVLAFLDDATAGLKFEKEIRIISISEYLVEILRRDIDLLHRLSPAQFELLICERLDKMGHEVRQVGSTYARDGGIDIIAWPRNQPFITPLIAVQVKHSAKRKKIGPSPVKELKTAVAVGRFDAGLLVTNTSFTPTAEWWARQAPLNLRLRSFEDVRSWIAGNFLEESHREIPATVELVPGFPIRLTDDSSDA